jgi:hypothetical protein
VTLYPLSTCLIKGRRHGFGLYDNSQCQALERTQLALPLAPKRPRTMTHDDKRHGTVTLFAALDALEGKLIARTEQRHTHVEWLRFLKQIDRQTPEGLDIHLIQDNYATHKHAKVKAWLARHIRILAQPSKTPTGRPLHIRCRVNPLRGAGHARWSEVPTGCAHGAASR